MSLEKSARKVRRAAESETTSAKRAAERASVKRKSDAELAEAAPDVVKHEQSTAKPPRR